MYLNSEPDSQYSPVGLVVAAVGDAARGVRLEPGAAQVVHVVVLHSPRADGGDVHGASVHMLLVDTAPDLVHDVKTAYTLSAILNIKFWLQY